MPTSAHPITAALLAKTPVIAKPVRTLAVAIRIPHAPHLLSCASGGVLSANSGRKYPKNAAQTHGFGILSAPGMRPMRELSCPAHQTLSFTAVLSHRPCAAIRWPLTRAHADLARQGWILRLLFPGRRPRAPFCYAPCYASVGADDPVAVPKISALPYGGRLKF